MSELAGDEPRQKRLPELDHCPSLPLIRGRPAEHSSCKVIGSVDDLKRWQNGWNQPERLFADFHERRAICTPLDGVHVELTPEVHVCGRKPTAWRHRGVALVDGDWNLIQRQRRLAPTPQVVRLAQVVQAQVLQRGAAAQQTAAGTKSGHR